MLMGLEPARSAVYELLNSWAAARPGVQVAVQLMGVQEPSLKLLAYGLFHDDGDLTDMPRGYFNLRLIGASSVDFYDEFKDHVKVGVARNSYHLQLHK